MFNWDDLRVFGAVARTGSLAAAGRALGLNHATVSRRVAALERAAGTPLVIRLARSTPLTDTGTAIARLAEEMEAVAHRAAQTARASADSLTGTVTISAPPLLASAVVTPALASVRAAHPGLSIVLLAAQSLAALDRGEADIALRLVRPSGSGIIARKVGAIPFGLYAAPAIAALKASDWTFISYDSTLESVPQHRWLTEYAGSRPLLFRSSYIEAQIEACRAALGIAALPKLVGEKTSGLVRVDPANFPEPRIIWLVMQKDLRLAPAVRAVVDRLITAFTDEPMLR